MLTRQVPQHKEEHMFGVRNTPSKMASYSEAKKAFDRITPVRGRDPSIRPAAHRSNWNLTLREQTAHRDGESRHCYALKYYNTDIATFWDDGQIDLEVYPSMSTNRIVNSVFRWSDIATYWKDGYLRNAVTEVGERLYNTPQRVSILNGEVIAGAVPFETPRVDRKALNAALKEVRFAEFKLWLDTQMRLGITLRLGERWDRVNDAAVVTCLEQGVASYTDLLKHIPSTSYSTNVTSTDDVTDKVRIAVTRVCGAIVMESSPHFDTYKEVDNHVKARRKWVY